jgi:hypothetical protein
VTVLATVAIGLYPQQLFEAADASARALGAGGIAALIP